MNRLTDNDRHLGPFTWARWSKTFEISLRSSGDDEDHPDERHNLLRLIGFGWVLQVTLPFIIQPLMIRRRAVGWDAATIERLGRDWYHEIYPRVFGFSLSDMGNGYDFLQVFYGARTDDSSTDHSWCRHLPWKQWRCVRHSLYAPDGSHFHTEDRKAGWCEFFHKRDECPASSFIFLDYDDARIVADCLIEEREWHRGEGCFKWLRHFWPSKIRRSLDIRFNAEVGPEKGSWKGGTLGHGIDMLEDDTPEQAFRRYCELEHSRKGKKFKLRFLGAV